MAIANLYNICGFEYGAGDSTTPGTAVPESNGLTGSGKVLGINKLGNGSFGFRSNPTTTNTGYVIIGSRGADGLRSTSAAINTLCVHFRFKLGSLPSTNGLDICTVRETGAANKAGLRVNTDGTISLLRADMATAHHTGATVLSTGVEYEIALLLGTGATTTYELRINNVSEFSGSDFVGATAAGSVRIGKTTSNNVTNADAYFDDIILADDFPNTTNIHVLNFAPDGAGNYNTGFTGSYTDVDDAPAADGTSHDDDTTTTVDANDANDVVTFAIASVTGVIGSGATVLGVLPYVRIWEVDNTNIQVRVRSGSTDNDLSSANITSTAAVVGKPYLTDPATAATWTATALDSVEVGVELQGSTTNGIKVTRVGLMVAYIPAVSSGKAYPIYAQQ